MNLRIFCDFDGTITDRDTIDVIADYCIGEEKRRYIDDLIYSGQVSMQDGTDEGFKEINISYATAFDLVKRNVTIDPYFMDFYL